MLLLLGTLAVATLVTAIVTSSWLWLVATLAVDAVFAGYVASTAKVGDGTELPPVAGASAPGNRAARGKQPDDRWN